MALPRPENEDLLAFVRTASRKLGIPAPSKVFVHRGREIVSVDISSGNPFNLPPASPEETAAELAGAGRAHHEAVFFGHELTGRESPPYQWYLADIDGCHRIVDGERLVSDGHVKL